MSCKIWLKKKFLSRLSPCTFFSFGRANHQQQIHCRVVVQKSLPAFLVKRPIDLPCFSEISKKILSNPLDLKQLSTSISKVHHLQVHLLRNFQGIDFSPFHRTAVFPFWNFDPPFSPWAKTQNWQPGGPLFGDAGETSLHRRRFLVSKTKKTEEFGPKTKMAKRFPSFFYPFLVEKNSRRKKANIHEFQRFFPCFRCLAPNPQVLPAIHPGGFRFRIRRQIRIESGASWGFLRSTIYTPGNSTWNLEMMVSNRNLLFQGAPIFRFHVCFGGAPTIRQCLFWFNLEKWHEMITFSIYYVNINYPPWNLTDLTASLHLTDHGWLDFWVGILWGFGLCLFWEGYIHGQTHLF